jgi:hypothetical protein
MIGCPRDPAAECSASHRQQIERFFRDGFVHRDMVVFTATGNGLVRAEGTLVCAGGLVCHVHAIIGPGDCAGVTPQVAGSGSLTYEVTTENEHLAVGRTVFRYENTHRHAATDGPNHRHVFDPGSGSERIHGLGRNTPTLAQVLEDMRHFYWSSLQA